MRERRTIVINNKRDIGNTLVVRNKKNVYIREGVKKQKH